MNQEERDQRDEDVTLKKWDRLGKGRVFVKSLPRIPSDGNMFASLHGKLTSGDICQAFVDRGLTADSFAGKIQELIADPKTSTHALIRLLTLASRILAQSEGATVTVNGPTDRAQKEIEAEVALLEQKFLGGAVAKSIGPETPCDAESGVDAAEQGSSGELQAIPEGDTLA
jgi:hypothetical protein